MQVTVDRPDVAGRVEILKVHARGKSLSKDVDLDKIARRTPGFTGERGMLFLELSFGFDIGCKQCVWECRAQQEHRLACKYSICSELPLTRRRGFSCPRFP